MVNSIADLAFLLSQFFLIIIRCGSICPYGYSYGSKFYELYVYLHLGYTFALFAALNDIGVSIDRALSFRLAASNNQHASKTLAKSSNAKRNYVLRIAFLFIASFILNLPMYVLSREIAPVAVLAGSLEQSMNSSDTRLNLAYQVVYVVRTRKDWEQSVDLKRFRAISWTTIRVGLFVILLLVNLFIHIKFKSQIRAKNRLSTSKQKTCIQLFL